MRIYRMIRRNVLRSVWLLDPSNLNNATHGNCGRALFDVFSSRLSPSEGTAGSSKGGGSKGGCITTQPHTQHQLPNAPYFDYCSFMWRACMAGREPPLMQGPKKDIEMTMTWIANAARRSALVASFSDVTSDRRFGKKGPVVPGQGTSAILSRVEA